ncbi:MAG: transposase [Rubrivivax sp.]|nr:MAG: transposase [Rubrivivax sp.]
MAHSFFPSTRDTLPLKEFVDYCHAHVRYEDEASIAEASDRLAMLANDRMLLINALQAGLMRHIEQHGEILGVSSQSLILHADRQCKVRAVIWKPPVNRAGSDSHDARIYSYRFAHNHNFHLLTAGYFGPGYETEIYECDPYSIQGYVGEPVDLKHLERTTLPRGKVMFFRSLKDVHTQLPAEEFSISLNLLVNDPTGRVPDQYGFDIEQSRLTHLITVPMAAQISMLSFLSLMKARNALPTVIRMAESDAHWRARVAAYECIHNIAPELSSTFWRQAEDDRHPMVQRMAREHLEALA